MPDLSGTQKRHFAALSALAPALRQPPRPLINPLALFDGLTEWLGSHDAGAETGDTAPSVF